METQGLSLDISEWFLYNSRHVRNLELVYKMNIFYLHKDPATCAQQHNDKHVVKMIVEYAQIMSTNHRLLDGEMYIAKSENTGRNIKRWRLDGNRDNIIYKACHMNHPSTVWARANNNNYNWLYALWVELCKEYTHRYGKIHKTDALLRELLATPPKNIPTDNLTQPTPAMKKFPQCIVEGDSLQSYRNYYHVAKAHFNVWTNRPVPDWYGVNA